MIYATAGIFVERNIEFFYQLGIFVFDIKRVVFGVVLTALGNVITEFVEIINAYKVVGFIVVEFLRLFPYFGI